MFDIQWPIVFLAVTITVAYFVATVVFYQPTGIGV